MKTVVFVDELLLVNFAAAAALLLGAGLLCGRSCTGLRLCAGSAAAAVSTLVLLALQALAPGWRYYMYPASRCAAGCPRRCGKP